MRFVAALLLLLVGALHATRTPYDKALAFRAMSYSAMTFCDEKTLTAWSCRTCRDWYPHMELQAVVEDGVFGGYGYVAWDPDLGRVVVAFRGSVNVANVITDIEAGHHIHVFDDAIPGAKAHSGFYNSYMRLRGGVHTAVDEVVRRHPEAATAPHLVVGHSLGAALAEVCIVDFALSRPQEPVPEQYSFGTPRVGNTVWAEWVRKFPTVWHTTNARDPVPHLPGVHFPLPYRHPPAEWFFPRAWPDPAYNVSHGCSGTGEDPACSNQYEMPVHWVLTDHLKYFGYSPSCDFPPLSNTTASLP